jgi:predicted hydrolase (HD superfamily)
MHIRWKSLGVSSWLLSSTLVGEEKYTNIGYIHTIDYLEAEEEEAEEEGNELA